MYMCVEIDAYMRCRQKHRFRETSYLPKLQIHKERGLTSAASHSLSTPNTL